MFFKKTINSRLNREKHTSVCLDVSSSLNLSPNGNFSQI